MTNHYYRTLLGTALAATFIGAAVAQTTSDDASRLPANKGTPQAQQAQPADQPTDKMKGQGDAQTSDQSGKASSKPAKPASKSQNQPTAAAEPSEKAFRQALRECAKQSEQSQRDSCLDNAIEQFQRG